MRVLTVYYGQYQGTVKVFFGVFNNMVKTDKTQQKKG